MILVDTNIPLRIAQPHHPHRQVALDALERLIRSESERFAIAPQSLYEMYVVCTRPASVNGFGMAVPQARTELAATRTLFTLLPELPDVYNTWERPITSYAVSGKRAHDVRLVAFMIEHRIGRLLTFNDTDFRAFTAVKALNPFDVLSIPPA